MALFMLDILTYFTCMSQFMFTTQPEVDTHHLAEEKSNG